MSQSIARALLEIDAVGFLPDQPIRFKSGILSPVYVDNRKLPYHPQQWSTVIEGLRELVTQRDLRSDVIAGVAMGGVPHSAALAYTLKRPSVFIRKEAKEHGKGQRIEGGSVVNQRVLLVEDLVTTGGSSLSAVGALREAEAICQDMLAIVSYDFAEAQTHCDAAHVTLHTLTNFTMIMQEAIAMKKLTVGQHSIVEAWFSDPYAWTEKQQRS